MVDARPLSETFLEQSPECQWIVSAEGVFHRVYGDPLPLLGKSAAELEGQSASQALDPRRAGIWKARFARALQGETLALRERLGTANWYINVFPLRVDGRVSYAGGLAREITAWSTAEQELRNTVLYALKAQESERRMVSKFLHDSVGQNLTALGLQLDLIRMDMESVSPQTCSQVAEIQKLLEEVMEEVREYTYELNPSAVERAGLRSALDRLAVRTRERFQGVVRVIVDPSLRLDPKIATALYQIAQEALGNAVQHSSCSVIEIAVKSTRTGTTLEVRDNGKGFDPGDLRGGARGLGLLSMEHYAAQAGIDFTIQSNPGTGTTVRAAAPEAA